MLAAQPLPVIDDLDVFPMDDAYLAKLPPEVRGAILAAEERISEGSARLVPHVQVLRDLEHRHEQG